jgi:hypothetical protein
MFLLRTVCLPDPTAASLALAYATCEDARKHLIYHLLGPGEAEAWLLLEPRLQEYFADGRDAARWRQRLEHHDADAQLLYDLYCEVVQIEMEDARRLHWHAQERRRLPVCVGLGTGGVLAVFEQTPQGWVLKTAFIAGAGRGVWVRRRQGWDKDGIPPGHIPGKLLEQDKRILRSLRRRSLRRRQGMRAGRSPDVRARDRQLLEQRQARWSPEERIYYLVFRPALQFIWRQQETNVLPDGRIYSRDYALLKMVLPLRSELTFDVWQQCRQKRVPPVADREPGAE